ncbi:unnamed protein product [Rotaria sordida]|uniref:Uncharacterized protein n=1 Tax=Rotaria sordida TaxID=392033 RepID=A0A818N5U9_9BILA|nr:unnamed protein product [Rotaria sordida]CAF1073698.1 unnamed protein product [Rotaria sordida]CAF3600009.1 unnamed protein product [Rotaria sordida]CAF3716275.1 unnamed protein product [Rotaria sordida]
MSTITYTNQIPLQQTNAPPPPPPPPQRYMNSRCRGGRYYNGYNGGGYSIISRSTPRQGRFYQRPIRRINQNRPESRFNRPRSRSNQRRSRSNQQGMSQLRQQRTRGPRRRQDRNRQQQQSHRNKFVQNNRFAPLVDIQDIDQNEIDLTDEESAQYNTNNKKNKKLKKTRLYLEPNRMLSNEEISLFGIAVDSFCWFWSLTA